MEAPKAAKPKKPRLPTAKHWIFTYWVHMDPMEQKNRIIKALEPYKYDFQLEKGSETGENQEKQWAGLHFQGWLSAEKKFRPGMRFRGELPKCSWRVAGGSEWNARKYVWKAETHVDGPWTNCEKPLPPQPEVPPHQPKRPLRWWQQDILDIIKTEPDSRTVHWYWSVQGDIGKSDLAWYIEDNVPDACVVTGKAWDAHAEIWAYFEELDRKPTTVVLNCCRDSSHLIEKEMLESIKDGRFTLTKGTQKERKRMRMFSPHLIVFANEPPIQKLSADRWHIVKVG